MTTHKRKKRLRVESEHEGGARGGNVYSRCERAAKMIEEDRRDGTGAGADQEDTRDRERGRNVAKDALPGFRERDGSSLMRNQRSRKETSETCGISGNLAGYGAIFHVHPIPSFFRCSQRCSELCIAARSRRKIERLLLREGNYCRLTPENWEGSFRGCGMEAGEPASQPAIKSSGSLTAHKTKLCGIDGEIDEAKDGEEKENKRKEKGDACFRRCLSRDVQQANRFSPFE